ncbi:hypothetical protein T08_9424 [Trichinella sp. T8]|nr:hypothetical protein T08_9424 [Trichinella sp. T8]
MESACRQQHLICNLSGWHNPAERPVLRKYVPTTVLSSSLATLFTGLSSVDWLNCVCFDIDTSSDAGFQQAFSHRIEHDFNAHSSP